MTDAPGSAAAWDAAQGSDRADAGGYTQQPGRDVRPPDARPLHGSGQNHGPLGERRSIGTQVLLSIVTLGIYGLYWAYVSHDEVKRHSGEGVGGIIGLVIYALLGVVTLFLLPLEIKRMYEREGLESPVSGATAFWVLLFVVPWYVKCQDALNRYWAIKGVPA